MHTINQMANKLARQMTPEYGNGNEGENGMKLEKVKEVESNDFDEMIFYVGNFNGEKLEELRRIAEIKGIASEFYSMAFMPNHYYATEETINKFNS